jgi:hypothetical protein
MRHPTSQLLAALIAAALLASGCGDEAPGERAAAAAGPSPTVASIFLSSEVPTAIPLPTIQPLPTPDSQARTPASKLIEVRIFDEEFETGWSLEGSEKMRFSTQSDAAYSGRSALAVTPTGDFGRLLFAAGAKTPSILRDQLAGISLWIAAGDVEIAPSELAVAIIGSNDYRYWRADDHSVMLDNQHFFSETRLYYLGINRAIPPGTWVELVVWLDQLPFDPDYSYVTGVYIKNDKGFREQFYVDRVSLLLLPKE